MLCVKPINCYLIVMHRSMSKVKSRRKSQLYRTDHELWRPWLLFLLLCGRNRLQSILNAKSAILVGSCRVYTEKDDAGLGKNIMYERDRALGEEAYSRALRKYALEVTINHL